MILSANMYLYIHQRNIFSAFVKIFQLIGHIICLSGESTNHPILIHSLSQASLVTFNFLTNLLKTTISVWQWMGWGYSPPSTKSDPPGSFCLSNQKSSFMLSMYNTRRVHCKCNFVDVDSFLKKFDFLKKKYMRAASNTPLLQTYLQMIGLKKVRT